MHLKQKVTEYFDIGIEVSKNECVLAKEVGWIVVQSLFILKVLYFPSTD